MGQVEGLLRRQLVGGSVWARYHPAEVTLLLSAVSWTALNLPFRGLLLFSGKVVSDSL